ncbi:MAG: hypothetical protein IIC84_05890 [Chloroflexi bacterium]|nr:hypothetical protein [Chloroflexota bacterium]
MHKFFVTVAIGALSIAALACNAAAAPSTDSPIPVPSDDSDLLRLVERIFSGPNFTESSSILPGQLPPDFDLPLPEGSEVVGSVIMTMLDGSAMQVLLDAPGEPEAVFSSWTDALAAKGWQSRNESRGNMDGGFVSSFSGTPGYALLCSETEGGYLTVSAFPLGDGTTDLRLNLQAIAKDSPCNLEPLMRVGPSNDDIPFPSLTTPPGVKQFGNHRSSGTSSSGLLTFTTQTDLEGTLSAVQVEAHYQGQLTEAGWTLLDNNTAGPSAWSTWQFTDDDGETWGAMLLILKSPGVDDNLLAYLRASR